MTNLERWRHYTKDIESPDSYIEWGFYHMISSALQRRVWLYSDPDKLLPGGFSLFPNMFIIPVGVPATGKGRVITQIGSIIKSKKLEKPGVDGKMGPRIPYSPTKGTLEALIEDLSHNIHSRSRTITIKGKETKQGYAYTPYCFILEELEVLFTINAADVVMALGDIYDSHDLDYKTKHHGKFDIKNICCTLIAGTTPDSIRDLMASRVVKKGLTSRVIMVFESEPRFYRQFPGIDESQQKAYDELTDHIKALTEIWGEITMSPDAAKYHKELYESGVLREKRINRDQRLDDYYGRKNAHWLKLGMNLLFRDQLDSFVIQQEHMEEALAILNRTEVRMHEAFANAGRNELFDSMCQIESTLKQKGPQHRNKMWWEFSRDLNKMQFDECLDVLITTGKIAKTGDIFNAVVTNENGNNGNGKH